MKIRIGYVTSSVVLVVGSTVLVKMKKIKFELLISLEEHDFWRDLGFGK